MDGTSPASLLFLGTGAVFSHIVNKATHLVLLSDIKCILVPREGGGAIMRKEQRIQQQEHWHNIAMDPALGVQSAA